MLLSYHVRRKFRFSVGLILLTILNLPIIQAQKTLGMIKKSSGNDENGYVLFSPINCDTTYLIDKCGKKVHHWVSEHSPGMSLYLLPNGDLMKSGTYTDTAFGFAGGRGGIIEEFDWDGNLIWRYKVFNDSLCQHHDIKPLPNGHVLVLAWHTISKNKALALGRRSQTFTPSQTELWGERILELKPVGKDSAEVVWQWDIFDHIVQDVDTIYPNFGVVANHPELMNINYALNLQTFDWIHANSLDYNPKLDQIVISAHNICEIWVIDHSTTTQEAASHRGGTYDKGGDFLYRWGNPEAYDMGTSSDRKLFRQHNANWIPGGYLDSGCIMIFNNGWGRDTAYSSVDVIQTPILSNGSYLQNLPFGPAKPKWLYKDSIPKNFYSQIISGAERMPNGNTLICSGVQGLFFEVTPQKKTVWKYKNPVNANLVLSDGANSNNQVFRASFYPSSFPAFKNKTLVGSRTIERNSQIYSCNSETVSPTVVKLMPGNNAQNISIDSTLYIQMSETVLKVNANIQIYVNGLPYELINTNSDLVSYNQDVIRIKHARKFPYNARVSVKVPVIFARDSSFNFTTKGIDTLQWHFNTERVAPYVTYVSPDSGAIRVARNPELYMVFNTRLKKGSSGGVTIFENGQVKEFIPVSSSRIQVSGNVVEILNTIFSYEKTVIITLDNCLEDTLGNKIQPLVYGRWIFDIIDLPKVVSLSPTVGAVDVNPKSTLRIEFDRYMRADSVQMLEIYSNNVLYAQVPTNSPAIESGGTELSIKMPNGLPENASISVIVPAYAFKDNYNTWFMGLSNAWSFTTGKNTSVHSVYSGRFELYPNPCADKLVLSTSLDVQSISLQDVYGKTYTIALTRISDTSYSMDITDLPAGIYLVRLGDESPVKLIKL